MVWQSTFISVLFHKRLHSSLSVAALFTLYSAFEEIFQLSPQDTFGVLGLTALIDCSPPYSVPPATVSWLKDSQSLPSDRFTVLSNGSLQIMSVENSDAGQYVCVAENSVLGISHSSSAANFSVYGKCIRMQRVCAYRISLCVCA